MSKMKKIGLKEKAKILEESYKPGCVIAELAKKHRISTELLYAWRTRYKKSNNSALGVTNASPISGNSNKFVEVIVSDTAIAKENTSNRSALQKALLEYENLIITVEGEQSSRILPEIVKILGTAA